MALNNLLAHCQADPGAVVFVPLVEALEDLEDLVAVAVLDADPVVADREAPLPLSRFGLHLHPGRAVAAEFDRVGNQVLAELGQLGWVALHFRQRAALHLRTRLLDRDLEVHLHCLEDLLHVDLLEFLASRPHPRELQQVIDQPAHPLGPINREIDELGGLLVEAFLVAPFQQLDITGHHAERLTQVVGGHIGKVRQLGVGCLEFPRPLLDLGLQPCVGINQPLGHPVEVARQFPDFVRPVLRHPA